VRLMPDGENMPSDELERMHQWEHTHWLPRGLVSQQTQTLTRICAA
jgi:hypothetical protein